MKLNLVRSARALFDAIIRGSPNGTKAQAIVFLTHIESQEINNHFDRLKAQTSHLADVYLCFHRPIDRGVAVGDFLVTAADEQSFVFRYAEKLRNGGTIWPGFSDLAYMPALSGARLAGYSHIWLLEYDVDYSGRWDAFFAPLSESGADLIGTTFYPRDQCSDWMWWKSLRTPVGVASSHHVRSFLPIVRFSRRMIDCYVHAIQSGEWSGHTEALYPTIALHNGMTIEDMGGNGPYTPQKWRGKNYVNTPAMNGDLVPGTFTPRPPTQTAYFYAAPETYPLLGYLYHPVKSDG
jgi:hypothetical protein